MKNNNFILESRNITKRYGSLVALDDVSIQLYRNEILALVGDNGAGKSTLIKILSGALLPDSGEIFIEGKKVHFYRPRDAKNLGIETVYQNLGLVEQLSIVKNLFLGKEIIKRYGFLNILQNKEMEIESMRMLEKLGIDIRDSTKIVSDLSGGQRQSVAISKSVYWSKKIIILDEPTAALGVNEASKMLNLILKLKEQGLSIIIITHNMEHAFMVSDRFFVLRLGKKVGEAVRMGTTVDDVVKMITGAIFVRNG